MPSNTQANTQWSLKTFNSWTDWRCKAKPGDPVPKDILTCADANVLNKWLSLFVLEARRIDGTRYPTSTLNMLLSGLKRFVVRANPNTPNFLDEDTRFSGLRGTRDTVARKLREEGMGSFVRHAAVIFYDEEESLWKAGTLGLENPKALLNAIFFMNGKVLCLQGGREQKSLKIAQFMFGSDQGEFVVYTENGSKNHSGTYKEKAGDNKIIKHYANSQLGIRCYVFLLRFYLQKLAPKVLVDPESVFYWKPRDVVSASDTTPWFTLQVIGRIVLSSMVKRMFQEVGIEGKTNHLLRATGATRLFEANVPEKLIKERTGHKSLDALRLYERTSVDQQKSVSNLMCSSSKEN